MAVARLNGTDLFYVEAGQGLPCLVLHGGLGFDHTYQARSLAPLGDVLRLVFFDQRGHGRSGRPPVVTLTHDQLADDADALRAHLGFDRVAVLGNSYGGIVALEYALRYPGRVGHLILVGTTAVFDYFDEALAGFRRKGATDAQLEALSTPPESDAAMAEAVRLYTPLYFHAFDPEVAERAFGQIVFSAAAARRARELRRSYNVLPRLGEIRAPTLVLVGRDDVICPPAQSERLHAGIPHSELVVFERSGHYPWLEEPDAFFAAMRGWLARHP